MLQKWIKKFVEHVEYAAEMEKRFVEHVEYAAEMDKKVCRTRRICCGNG